MTTAMPSRLLLSLPVIFLFACARSDSTPTARLASSTTAPSLISQLQGKWKLDSADSGDPMVSGDHPWSLVELTISAESYVVRRADGTQEQGAFSIIESKNPKQVLFFNWGHKDQPRKAVFELNGKTLKVATYTKDFGEHSCLSSAPPKVDLPSPSDPAYAETVLYTFTRE